jgi:outer membrane protease
MKKTLFLFSAFLLFSAPAGRCADAKDENNDFFVAAQAGRLSGNTLYHMSVASGVSSVDSELEFPLQTGLAGIKLGYAAQDRPGRSRVKLALSWLQNTDSGSGSVKDSDWLSNDQDILEVGSPHPGKDIYSESDMELKARLIEVQAVFGQRLGKTVEIGPMAGFKYQQFKYDVSDVNQVGYGPYAASYTGSVAGPVATYEVEYQMFYVGLSADFRAPSFTATAGLAFAPAVVAEDRDDHILRSKLSTGKATGFAYLASLGADWDLLLSRDLNVTFGINGEYLRISTQGTQDQTFYAGANAGESYSLDDKITSEQLLLTGNLAFHF